MVLIDLFSGIGGFHLGLSNAGYQFSEVYFSEVDQHCIANYHYKFSNATYAGSIKSLSELPQADIITFGSPCQNFSIAGNRKGLRGQQSALIGYALDLIERQQPPIFIWENVKGAFTSQKGRDFQAIVQRLTYSGLYRLEWQLLNSSWILPQNRERIILVGHHRDASRPKVFPFRPTDQAFVQKTKHQPQTKAHFPTISTQVDRKCSPYIIQKGRGYNQGGLHEQFPTITSHSWENNHFIIDARSYDRDTRIYDSMPCLTANMGNGGRNVPYYYNTQDYIIRRITALEAERAQGFPDNWTKFGKYENEKKEIAMTNRYRMIGNAVSPPIIELVGRRLLES